MALSLLLLVLFAGLLLCFLFIIRLYIVVKNGSTRVSGNKAPVTVLAVVGSGNANYLRRIQGCFVSWIPSRSMSLKLDFGRNVQRLAHVLSPVLSLCASFTGARSWRCFATCQRHLLLSLSFRSCAKLVMTFTMTVPQVDTQRRSYGWWSPCPRSTHLGTMWSPTLTGWVRTKSARLRHLDKAPSHRYTHTLYFLLTDVPLTLKIYWIFIAKIHLKMQKK